MNFFWKLQRREQVMIICSGVAVLLVLLFLLVVDPLLKRSAQLDRQITTAQKQVKELQTLQQDYLRQKSVADRINVQLKQQQKNFAIFSRLEELAGQTGIKNNIRSMRPSISTPNEIYNEESVEITMDGVTLEQLVRYLHQIENSPQWLKIKRLYVKPRLDNRQILSVVFRVSVFTLKEGVS